MRNFRAESVDRHFAFLRVLPSLVQLSYIIR